MSAFHRALGERGVDPAGRRWLFAPYDQLSDALGPLSREDPAELGIVVVETPWKPARRPYHRQKLALVLANLRHFALEQATRGVAVRHVVGDGPYGRALEPVARELGPLRVMRPAERELRADLAALLASGALVEIPHEGWLTSREQFEAAFGRGRRGARGDRGGGREHGGSREAVRAWKLDTFYRHVRRETGILMERGQDGELRPRGGRFSFDTENRKPWKGEPEPPSPPRFEPDEITREVGDLVERHFPRHPGELDLAALSATAPDAERLWRWARRRCLEHFGPYQDAMTTRSSTLFHTRISALLNLHRLTPRRVVMDVERMDLSLASQEGFIRQVLGWREFVHHVHEATDGFRRLPGRGNPRVAEEPGDGGWGRWKGRAWRPRPAPDGGARPSFLRATSALSPAYWGEPSGLHCLDAVVGDVWREGYGHHITRLMVLANLATLLDISPRELTDWFWVAYTDAYDWVVEPNVLGMGTFAVGDLFTTKPYVSGAAYIDRMSDYCRECAFPPGRDCPVTPLYWAFLDRHWERLASNPRLRMPYASLAKRSVARRRRDRETFEAVREALRRGERLRPDPGEGSAPPGEPVPPRGRRRHE